MSDSISQVDLNTKVILAKVPDHNYPRINDIFQITFVPPVPTDNVPNGSLVVRNMFLSIDATMRIWISGVKTYVDPVLPGDMMKGLAIGQVIFSKGKIKQGTIVMGNFGWQKYCMTQQKGLVIIPKQYPNPEHFLGIYGISGLTAYVGLFEIGKIKPGEIVVVSAAAGAVGQLAVQIAKNHGCIVTGIAGGKEKCEYVKSIGADFVIDYKNENYAKKIKQVCPKGIDVYFDNVGGQMLDDTLMNIRDNCRIVLCGTISSYNQNPKNAYKLKNYSRLIIKKGIMQGYLYFDYTRLFKDAIKELMKQVKEGKLKFRTDILNGIQQAPRGLQRLLTGQNKGKVIIRVHKDPYISAKL